MSNKFLLFETSRAQRFDAEYPFFVDMRASLREQAKAIMEGGFPMCVDTQEVHPVRVGIEMERSCVCFSGQPLPESVRNQLVAKHPGWQMELGAAQIEIMTPAIDVTQCGGFTALKGAMIEEDSLLVNVLGSVGARPVRMGSDPIVFADQRGRTTSKEKERYRIVPDFHTKNRRPGMPEMIGIGRRGQVRVCEATSVVPMSSVQFNMDAASMAEAVALLNAAFEVGPITVALGANARYMNGVDTGFADVRAIVWEMSHDIRTHAEVAHGLSGRTGLPDGYFFDGIGRYLTHLHDQPSILNEPESALTIANGLMWMDARIKFLRVGGVDPQIVVEFRPVSVQPSVEDEYFLMAFAVGYVYACSCGHTFTRLPFHLLHDNRASAALYGSRGKLWTIYNGKPRCVDASVAVERALDLAVRGMQMLGASDVEIAEVRDFCSRWMSGGCPSDQTSLRFHVWRQRRGVPGRFPITRKILRDFIIDNEKTV